MIKICLAVDNVCKQRDLCKRLCMLMALAWGPTVLFASTLFWPSLWDYLSDSVRTSLQCSSTPSVFICFMLSLPHCFPLWYASFDPHHRGSVSPENHRQMSPLHFFGTITGKEDESAPFPCSKNKTPRTSSPASPSPPSPKCSFLAFKAKL